MLRTLLLIFILFGADIRAQEVQNDDEWSEKMIYTRFFKNGKMLSDITDKNFDEEVYGKISHFDDKNRKVLELMKYNAEKEDFLPVMSGVIENLKTEVSFQNDSTLFVYKMHYKWLADNGRAPAEVTETQIISLLTEVVITKIHIKFTDKDEAVFGWSFKESPFNTEKGIKLPKFLKIKRIAVIVETEENMRTKDMDDPEDKILYALWTKDSFHRYGRDALRDEIEFQEMIDSVNTTPYVVVMTYLKKDGGSQFYMNNYYEDNYGEYVSTIDTGPFPLDAGRPVISSEAVIVWESFDLINEYVKMSIQSSFIGSNGFTDAELKDIEEKMLVIMTMIQDYKRLTGKFK